MILEYVPTNFDADLKNLYFLIEKMNITHVLFPQNPINKVIPSSLSLAILFKKYFPQITFIPTAKANILNTQSFNTLVSTMQYAQINHLAIISGDVESTSKLKSDTLKSVDLLKILQEQNIQDCLNIFCAIKDENDLNEKIKYGVRNFITQPFFNPKSFLKFKDRLNYVKNINVFCSVFLLPSKSIANIINKKKIGIEITKSFIAKLEKDVNLANKSLLDSMKSNICNENISLGYINYDNLEYILK